MSSCTQLTDASVTCPPVHGRNTDVVLSSESRDFARLAARNDYPVLLEGETGVGKTHLARLIHGLSGRSRRPFVHVNCGAIPDELFEAEMFGHVRGAFTDAKEAREGFFECANAGTLVLDEIGDLPARVQPKLLTALEGSYIRRVGSVRETHVDVRLIAATNANLAERATQGRFREDLYHRCAVLTCRLPALRERGRDLPQIVRAFFEDVCGHHTTNEELDSSALDVLCEYTWPGNLRELENVLRLAVVLADGRTVRPTHLPMHVRRPQPAQRLSGADPSRRRRYVSTVSAAQEKESIEMALGLDCGNRTRAAKRLGMSRSTLWVKMQALGIISSDFAPSKPWASVPPNSFLPDQDKPSATGALSAP